MTRTDELDLWDYRRRVADVYHDVRRRPQTEDTWMTWRGARDELFREHPQSPLDSRARTGFQGLRYFPYDPKWRFEAVIHPGEEAVINSLGHSRAGETPFHRFGQVGLEIGGTKVSLSLYWLECYGGGVFVPFGDLTNGEQTYGGGRYLLDTVKGADLGHQDGKVVLDFNYSYHPSCVHSDRWSCPLAPVENRLPLSVTAGERL